MRPARTARLRIGLLASLRHGLREPHAGGLERHTAVLVNRLRARGHQVSVFASADADPELQVEPICSRESLLDLSPAARADVSMLSERFMVEHDAYQRFLLDADRLSSLDVLHDNSLDHLPVVMAPLVPVPIIKTLHTPPTPWLESALATTGACNVIRVSVSQDNAARWDRVDHIVPNGVETQAISVGSGGNGAVWSG